VQLLVVTGFWSLVCTVEEMGNQHGAEGRARRQQRERQRRLQVQATGREEGVADSPKPQASGATRRAAASACGWCGGPITPGSRGPIPKWCSASCRQRAWEQSRAAAAGLTAIRVVERQVEVRLPVTPTRRDWSRLLVELARQLDGGRIYDRDLQELGAALDDAVRAFERRPYVRDRAAAGRPI